MTKSDGTRHTFADLYHERTEFQFIERSWRWAILSGALIVISIVSLIVSGLNLGIDFEGGTSWQFTVSKGSASVTDVRDALRPLGLADAKVLVLGNDGVRVQAEDLPNKTRDQVTDALAKYGGITASEVSLTDVGPTWGQQVSEKALRALVVFFVLIGLYLAFRFEWKMSASAIAAVLHDIIITAGVYSVFGFEVTPATVVAFLTILGFSLYDTVVVFDKVRENQATIGTVPGDTYSAMVNRSLNQVLMRSLNTTLVALLPVASLLVVGSGLFGAVTLRDFALALFVGLATGAYSSIFVATPILAWWKEHEPRNRALRERSAKELRTSRTVARAGARVAASTPASPPVAPATTPPDAGADEVTDEPVPAGVEQAAPISTSGQQRYVPPPRAPRPRQQRRKKRK
jgi:preprotein translocase subunit SecF